MKVSCTNVYEFCLEHFSLQRKSLIPELNPMYSKAFISTLIPRIQNRAAYLVTQRVYGLSF